MLLFSQKRDSIPRGWSEVFVFLVRDEDNYSLLYGGKEGLLSDKNFHLSSDEQFRRYTPEVKIWGVILHLKVHREFCLRHSYTHYSTL